MDSKISQKVDDRGVCSLILNNPDRHNAFDDQMIADLIKALDAIEADPKIRCVLLKAEGKSFSSGADLTWMKKMVGFSVEENTADAAKLGLLLERLDGLNKPVIGQVQGAAYGGGVGLVACCDIVIASTAASFCLSEARIGLIPSLISPYVIAKMGAGQARRYFLTAEAFSADQALQLGLVHELCSPESLAERVEAMLDILLKNGPIAVAEAKKLVAYHESFKGNQAQRTADLSKWIAELRVSKEGQEGMQAFFEKRKPSWSR